MTSDTAYETILSLIYPRKAEDLTEKDRENLIAAAQYQREFEKSHTHGIKSETVGDVSISYDNAKIQTVCGKAVSPDAYSLLISCGLLTRWV